MRKILLLLLIISFNSFGNCPIEFGYSVDGNTVHYYAVTSDSSGAFVYNWDLGDGNYSNQQSFSHAYSSSGTFTVGLYLLAGADSCYTSQSVTISGAPQVGDSCTANFSYSISGSSVFVSASVADSSATYEWYFGDGGNGIGFNTSYTYSAPGTYELYLYKYINGDSCYTSQFVTISAPQGQDSCSANFSYSISGNSVFVSASVADSSAAYSWNFGDGSNGSGFNTSYTYSTPGTYELSLFKFIGADSCYASQFVTISGAPQVGDSCSANFSYSISGNSVFVSASAADSSAAYSWNFGDGSNGSGFNTSYTYSTPGTYELSLFKFIDGDSCYSSQFVTISAPQGQDSCSANYSYTISDFSVSVSASLADSSATYEWYFGDGGNGIGFNTSYTYSAPGTYELSLYKYINGDSCYTSQFVTINAPQVGDSCTANFSYSISGNSVSVSASVADSSATYVWDFGNGGSGSGFNSSYTYSTLGTYDIVLVKFINGDSCTSSRTITISAPHEPCSVDFHFSISGKSVAFTALAIDTLYQYSYNLGDGNSISGATGIHTYANTGNYAVTLVKYSHNDSCFVTKTIVIPAVIPNTHSISGIIRAGNARVDRGRVTIFKLERQQYEFHATASLSPLDSGRYSFGNLPMGSYLVQVVPAPNSQYFLSHEPTFSGNVTSWRSADRIDVNENKIQAISLVAVPVPTVIDDTWNTGLDTLRGTITRSSQTARLMDGNETLDFALVTLFNSNGQKLTAVYSDENGNFTFANLIEGNYTIRVSYPGAEQDVEINAYVDGDPETVTEFSSVELRQELISSVSKQAATNFNVYPNPAVDQVTVSIAGNSYATVNILDVAGNKLLSASGSTDVTLNLGNIPSGYYLVQVINGESVSTKQLIKF
ncbi:MAG: PKD domain-containing protein [Cytophagaceae bacterium]